MCFSPLVIIAQHYGTNYEELDFIINYDIKYRLGQEADESTETID